MAGAGWSNQEKKRWEFGA